MVYLARAAARLGSLPPSANRKILAVNLSAVIDHREGTIPELRGTLTRDPGDSFR
jgi:hypothetical protein